MSGSENDQEPEATLRSVLVQPLSLQRCLRFPQMATLAADTLQLCFRDLSNQIVLPGHPILGHVLLLPCRLKSQSETSMIEKVPAVARVCCPLRHEHLQLGNRLTVCTCMDDPACVNNAHCPCSRTLSSRGVKGTGTELEAKRLCGGV